MVIGIGTDITEVSRIKEAIERYGERFINRIFTDVEITYCEQFNWNKYQHYAARFAAKEAFSKAIGTGLTNGFKFKEIGIVNEDNGKPIVALSNRLAEMWGRYLVHVSISHTDKYAVTFIVIESE